MVQNDKHTNVCFNLVRKCMKQTSQCLFKYDTKWSYGTTKQTQCLFEHMIQMALVFIAKLQHNCHACLIIYIWYETAMAKYDH